MDRGLSHGRVMRNFDFIVIGAGMAGASAAYNLAPHGAVLVLERETQPGYHSTGRSAALFTECYGNPGIRALTVGSRGFYQSPPPGFSDLPLVKKRGCLFIARADQAAALDAHFQSSSRFVSNLQRLDGATVQAMVPAFRENLITQGVLEPDAAGYRCRRSAAGLFAGVCVSMAVRSSTVPRSGGLKTHRRHVDNRSRNRPGGRARGDQCRWRLGG